MSKVGIIYWSSTGNTEAMAHSLLLRKVQKQLVRMLRSWKLRMQM